MGHLGGILLLIYADGQAMIIHLITAALSFQLDNTLRSEGIASYKCAKIIESDDVLSATVFWYSVFLLVTQESLQKNR